jgi:hypothetical protein
MADGRIAEESVIIKRCIDNCACLRPTKVGVFINGNRAQPHKEPASSGYGDCAVFGI